MIDLMQEKFIQLISMHWSDLENRVWYPLFKMSCVVGFIESSL